MEARHLTVRETVSASKKLAADDARKLLAGISTLIVSRGKKSELFDVKSGITDEMVAAMLGPAGNLRAPTLKIGKRLLVGFGDSAWQDALKA
jgi:hypothetical protein